MIWISALLAVGSPGPIPPELSAPVLQAVEQPGVVLGDDSKLLFALYDDGTVLHAAPRSSWTRGANGFPVARYLLTKLSPGEKQRLLAKLRPEELHTLKKRAYEGCRTHFGVTCLDKRGAAVVAVWQPCGHRVAVRRRTFGQHQLVSLLVSTGRSSVASMIVSEESDAVLMKTMRI